jgi:hypothetical protein
MAYITYSHPSMPWIIAHRIDLFLLQETTTAIMVPSPMPGKTYTGRPYPIPSLYGPLLYPEVQETINKVRIVSGRSVFFSMNFILKNE